MAKSAQKPKSNPGTRNPDRRNGKAWKRRACGKRHDAVICLACTQLEVKRAQRRAAK